MNDNPAVIPTAAELADSDTTGIAAAHAVAGWMLTAAIDLGVRVITVEASTAIPHPDVSLGVGIGARVNAHPLPGAEALAERLGLTDHEWHTSDGGHAHHTWAGRIDGIPASVTAVHLTEATQTTPEAATYAPQDRAAWHVHPETTAGTLATGSVRVLRGGA